MSRMFGGCATRHAATMFAGKIFRNVGKFNGEDRPWSQSALKVRFTVKSLTLASSGSWNSQVSSGVEVDMEEVILSNVTEHEVEKSAEKPICASQHQAAVGENELEVWLVLKRRYDLKTTLQNVQLWLNITNPGKFHKAHDSISLVNRLKRDDDDQEVPETATN